MTQDRDRFGPAARALSREALARAEEALTLPADLDPIWAIAAEIDRA